MAQIKKTGNPITERKSSPLITVMMVNYNYGRYIGEAIESVLSQTFTDFELIIYDDASTDNSISVIEKYRKQDPRILCYRGKENRGEAYSRNQVLKKAKGKYIAILDSDDRAKPQRLEIQYRHMEANPGITVLGGNMHIIGKNDQPSSNIMTSDEEIRANFIFNCSLPNPTTFIRREFFITTKIVYDEKFPIAPDYGLWIDALLTKDYPVQFSSLKEVVTDYRWHGDNLSNSGKNTEKIYQSHRLFSSSLLQALHVEVTETNIKKHIWFSYPTLIPKEDTLNRVSSFKAWMIRRDWLQTLLKGNDQARLIPESYLLYTGRKIVYSSIPMVQAPMIKKSLGLLIPTIKYVFFFRRDKSNTKKTDNPITEQKSSPLITVMIVNYNYGRYIGEAIESILSQTFTDFELIIYDDASTDDSMSVIEKYRKQDPRILCYRGKKNRGEAYSRNQVLKKAKGKYITILDSDDRARPQRLETQYRYMEANPGITVLGGNMHIIGKNDEPSSNVITSDEEIRANFIFNCSLPNPTTFIRREFFITTKIVYDEKFPIAPDYGLWIDALLTKDYPVQFSSLKEVVTDYRWHGENLSNPVKNTEKLYQSHRLLVSSLLQALHVEVTETNIKKHIWFSYPNLISKEDPLNRVSSFKAWMIRIDWLQTLLKGNAQSQLVSQSYLRYLGRKIAYPSNPIMQTPLIKKPLRLLIPAIKYLFSFRRDKSSKGKFQK